MKVSSLVQNIKFENSPNFSLFAGVDIKGLSLDSRFVEPDYLFAALAGEKFDGRDYIPQAIAKGAKAILVKAGSDVPHKDSDVLLLEHSNPRLALAQMAAQFYQPKPDVLFAVTGTNGKSSVASFVRQIWQALGFKAGSMGTLGIESDGYERKGTLTTADCISFHKDLKALAETNINHVVFEASSHGLDQYRIDGAPVRVAGFTNLTQDHLDYHKTMDQYFTAKTRLFSDILAPNGTAVINIETAIGQKLAKCLAHRSQAIMTVGRAPQADVRLVVCRDLDNGFEVEVEYKGVGHCFTLPLMGRFQVDNALLAAAMVLAEGGTAAQIFASLSHLKGVEGRMELAGQCPNGASVVVDYAHTPDGLENALKALRSNKKSARVLVVFGCGGNRDAGKRPLMGEIATRLADKVFVTDDNPRGENPGVIRAQILATAPQAQEYDDRRAAIFAAVAELEAGDVLLVTGKGHEQGQIVGDKILPFSDFEMVRAAIVSLNNKGEHND